MPGELLQLSGASLTQLPEVIARPHYDRTAITPGIVHIGLGNFHRAHQAWYLHRLMQQGAAMDWGILGAGVRPADEAQRERLKSQDFLTTLVELDPSGKAAEVVGSIIGFVRVEEDNAALVAQLADPAIRIVSLTVTEGGYFLDPITKAFTANHPDIAFDAANPETPRTAFGAMVAALKIRRDRGQVPFTGQSCDNLQGNGDILRQTVVSLARCSDPELADWIDQNCSFPNSMVDCIVPATGPREFDAARAFGVEDKAPVSHENFRQWVIEDQFCAGRPDWDKVGAIFTDAVHEYETMKIRILNGGHQLIANAGEVLGLEFISDCMEHALIREYLRKVATEEISPQVAPVQGMTPEEYIDLIESRFSNAEIIDTVRRVAFDGSSRHPGFVLPTLREAVAQSTSIEGLALSQAIWARMCAGQREDKTEIAANDPNWNNLKSIAWAARTDPQAWLEQRDFYGDLADESEFAAVFSKWLKMIYATGLESTLKTYLAG